MSDSWFVVHFKEENTVEAVPKSWYINESNECFWPSSKYNRTKINDIIKSRISPECDWKVYPARILGKYENFDYAQKKAHKATYTDVLSSGNEDIFSFKRKRNVFANHQSDSSSDSDCPSMPTPKSSKLPKQSYGNKLKNLSSASDTPNFSSNSANDLSDYVKKHEEFQRQVLRQLYLINNKLNEHSENFAILLKDSKEDNVITNSEEVAEILLFVKSMPIKSFDKLYELENWLSTEHKIDLLAKEMSRIGGDTVKEITKRILYTMMGNEIGVAYSWEGAKGKKMLKTLNMACVIIKAVRMNKRTSDAQDDEIIKVIKAWLLRAKDRLQNYRKRNTTSPEPEDQERTNN